MTEKRRTPDRSSARLRQWVLWVESHPWLPMVLLVLPFAALGLFLVFHHEPWRDETASYLVATQTQNLFRMLCDLLTDTDHPPMWFILLNILSNFTRSFFAVLILHWFIMLVAVMLLVFRSPFRWYEKLLISLGYLVLYEYGIIARNYGLGVLAMFGVACAHRQRLERPFLYAALIGLAATTNAFAAILAGFLFILFVWESFGRKPARLAYLLTLALFAFSLLYIMPVSQTKGVSEMGDRGLFALLQQLPGPERAYRIVKGVMNQVFLILPTARLGATHFSCEHPGHRLSLALGFAVLVFIVAPRRAKPALYFWLSSLAIWGFLLLRPGGIRHQGFLFINLLVAMWIDHYYADRPAAFAVPWLHSPRVRQTAFAVILACQALSGLNAAYVEWKYPFSYIEGAATALNRLLVNKDAGKTLIATFYSSHSDGMLVYMDNPEVRFFGLEFMAPYRNCVGARGVIKGREWHGANGAWAEASKFTLEQVMQRFWSEASSGKYSDAFLVLPFPVRGQFGKDAWLEPVFVPQPPVAITSDEVLYVYRLTRYR